MSSFEPLPPPHTRTGKLINESDANDLHTINRAPAISVLTKAGKPDFICQAQNLDFYTARRLLPFNEQWILEYESSLEFNKATDLLLYVKRGDMKKEEDMKHSIDTLIQVNDSNERWMITHTETGKQYTVSVYSVGTQAKTSHYSARATNHVVLRRVLN